MKGTPEMDYTTKEIVKATALAAGRSFVLSVVSTTAAYGLFALLSVIAVKANSPKK